MAVELARHGQLCCLRPVAGHAARQAGGSACAVKFRLASREGRRVSFLNQLRSKAGALENQQRRQEQNFEENAARCDTASRAVQHYFGELARQLNIIEPGAPALTLDGRTPWPPMRLVAFRTDARRKSWRGREVFDYIGLGWDVVPRNGPAIGGMVRANFPPDLERIESRLAIGLVEHERREERHPDKNSLLAYRYEYVTRTRGSVTVTADQDTGRMLFRLVNTSGFGLATPEFAAERVDTALLDDLARRIVSEPNTFAAE
ncbi:MAG: hypothetical protein ACJ8GO_05340 [Ramlibacter sp.]